MGDLRKYFVKTTARITVHLTLSAILAQDSSTAVTTAPTILVQIKPSNPLKASDCNSVCVRMKAPGEAIRYSSDPLFEGVASNLINTAHQ